MQTACGQMIDLITTFEGEKDLAKYSLPMWVKSVCAFSKYLNMKRQYVFLTNENGFQHVATGVLSNTKLLITHFISLWVEFLLLLIL